MTQTYFQFENKPQDDSLTVSQLNQFIKDVINAGFPQTIWICGEIQGYNRNRDKRHVFFELVEKDAGGSEVKARIGLVIFGNRKTFIQSVLKKGADAFELKDDIEVKFECKVDFYTPHGAVRLVVENIDPFYTLGKLAQEKQKLIALLKENGTLDKNKVLELPLVPLRIGLITSGDSAAYNDFLSELKKSGLGFQIYLRNTIMQGKNCEADVKKALKELQKISSLDIIVITRGGGSIADLSCFDSKVIAESIAASRLPVLSGIGHEIDLTVTDLAAHTFAKTPTAIAQYIVGLVELFQTNLKDLWTNLATLLESRLQKENERLKQSAVILQNKTIQFLKDHNEKIIRFKEKLKHQPMAIIKENKKIITDFTQELNKVAKTRLQNEQNRLRSYKKIIDIAHPANTMKRGFSVTRTAQGKLVRSVSDIVEDEELITEIVDGKIKSKAV